MALDFLSAIGGVGKGLMNGSEFVQRKSYQDQSLQLAKDAQEQNRLYRESLLKLNQDQNDRQQAKFDVEMGEVERAKGERAKADTLTTITNRVHDGTTYQGESEAELQKRIMDAGTGMGLYTPEKLEAAKKAYDGALKTFGVEAFDAATRGDLAPLNRVAKLNNLGSFAADGNGSILHVTPDGTKTSLSIAGLMKLPAMSGAYDRYLAQQEAALKARKIESEIGKNDRAYGIVTNPDGTQSYMGRAPGAAGGGKGAGHGSGKEDVTAGRSPFGDIKDHHETQTTFKEGISEQGLPFTDASGKEGVIPREEALSRIMYHAEKLYDTNPKLSVEGARDAARRATLAEKGMPGYETYLPRLQMNPKTGQMEAKIRTADGMELNYPTAGLNADPAQVHDAELKWIEPMIASGEARTLNERLKSPEASKAVTRAFMDPAYREVMERSNPGLLRRVEVLYANGALPDVVLPVQSLQDARARTAAIVESRRPKPARGTGAGSSGGGKSPQFSEEELARAEGLGAKPTFDVAGAASTLADKVGSAVSSGLDRFGAHQFDISLDAARRSQFADRGAAAIVLGSIEKNPALKSRLTDDELWAVQVAANRRMKN